jgi:hypothetical protein
MYKKNLALLGKRVTTGHDLKLVKPGCRLDCRKYAFSNRILNVWNNLPLNVVACSTVYSFKHKIYSIWVVRGLYKLV